jgi:hypothetical protein
MRKTLQEQIQVLTDTNYTLTCEIDDLRRKLNNANSTVTNMLAANKEKCEQIAELKTLLRNAELQQAQQEGYITRVREDDVVNEPLISVGDPEGDRSLVPKRKHLPLNAMQYVGDEKAGWSSNTDCNTYGGTLPKPRRSWINY